MENKVPSHLKEKYKKSAEELKNALKSDDTDKIKECTENLTKVMHEISSEIYKTPSYNYGQGAHAGESCSTNEGEYQNEENKGKEKQNNGTNGKGTTNGKTVDAEYRVVE
jgi:hypothetical protein